LVFFRVLFAITMLWEFYRYFEHDWIWKYWINPDFNFKYEFFEWMDPWPGNGMYIHFAILAILAVFIAFGFLYRMSTILFFLGFTYVFLLEQARYLNHFYLVCILSFLMIFVPAHRHFSLDAKIWPKLKTTTIASWGINLLRFQLAIVYIFGGIAKINTDWLQGKPMNMWLPKRNDFPIIGTFFENKSMIYAMSYGGLLLDLLVVPFLLWKKTRVFAFVFITLFHLMNDRLFTIGIFPWFMILGTTIFLPVDWPTKMLQLMRSTEKMMLSFLSSGLLFSCLALLAHRDPDPLPIIVGFIAGLVIFYLVLEHRSNNNTQTNNLVNLTSKQKTIIRSAFILWGLLQIIIPLRHFFIDGNVNWTEEGHRFSWHMKLRDKSGTTRFYSIDPTTSERTEIDYKKYLKKWQYRKMRGRPYLIHSFANYLASELKASGNEDIKIIVTADIALNGRKRKKLIKPNVDLTNIQYGYWAHNDWILLLDEP